MLSKRYHFSGILISVLCIIFITSCDKDDDNGGVVHEYTIRTVEGLYKYIQGINFEVTLPDGNIVRFSPGKTTAEASQTYFTVDDGGFRFTSSDSPFEVNAGNGNAILNFEEETLEFDLVICTTVWELVRKYPEISVPDGYPDYLLYVAVELDHYSERQAVLGEAVDVVNVLQLIVGPRINSPLEGYLTRPSGEDIKLFGSYVHDNDNFISSGYSYFRRNGDIYSAYNLKLACRKD